MEKLEKIDYQIIVLAIVAAALVAANFTVNIPSYDSQLGVNRTNAKQVQSMLEQYYADHHKYPNKKDFDTACKEIIGKIPCYKDGRKMVRLYKKINANRNKESYKIYFYDDRGTDEKENEFVMTDGTDTNKLFKCGENNEL